MSSLPELSTTSGTGTTLLGIRAQDDGSFDATAWDVWHQMPIRPRSRHRLRAVSTSFRSEVVGATAYFHDTHQLEVISDSDLIASEVRATRIWHWVIAPTILLLVPAALCILGWGWLADVAVGMGKKGSQGQAVGVVVAVIWLSLGGQLWVGWRNGRVKRLAKRAGGTR